MKVLTRRRIFVNLVVAAIISLLMTFPMIFDIMGFGPVGLNRNYQHNPFRLSDLVTVLKSFLFFLTMIFGLMVIYTHSSHLLTWTKKIFLALLFAVLCYLISPVIYQPFKPKDEMREAMDEPIRREIKNPPPEFEIRRGPEPRRWLEVRRIIEFSFILALTGLIGKIFELTQQREIIKLENEKLRAENLQSQYNILVNQVNPHFFFNSMNSLSALVREGKTDGALRYISELSNLYRNVLHNSGKDLVTLDEELKSLSGICYMFLVRYEGKLFFNINVDESLLNRKLPLFSLQPLVENAVKHNTITEKDPLTVTICSNEDGTLSVRNRIIKRKEQIEKSGTGLVNLASRFRLMTDKEIIIENDGKEFCVTLPLINGKEDENTNS